MPIADDFNKGDETLATPDQSDYILLDGSGSMGQDGLYVEAVGAINAYVRGLQERNVPTLLTVAVFDRSGADMRFDLIRRNAALSSWQPLRNEEAMPGGSTPYYDAIGRIVALALGDAPAKCCISIMTDGHNNTSTELTQAQARKMVDECRERGWQVIFMGASFNNEAQAQEMGASAGQTVSMARGTLMKGMAMNAAKRGLYGSGEAATMSYTPEEKKQLSGE